MNWCELYKKSDMKETIRIQAGGKDAEQFGSAALGGAVVGGGTSIWTPHHNTCQAVKIIF